MSITLHNLKRVRGSKKKKKRVGRGDASGHGTYSTRGQKGQKARSGAKGLKRLGLSRILRGTPKFKGQKPRHPKMAIVNISQLEQRFSAGDIINAEQLINKNLIKTDKNGIKILGQGKLTKKFTIIANSFSKSAKKAIIKAGGEVKIKH